ncbi:MAG: hypothetical protein ACLU4J_23945 [Butyricimonas paravirosa]
MMLQDSLGSVSEEPSVDIQVSDQMISYKTNGNVFGNKRITGLLFPVGESLRWSWQMVRESG